VKFIRLSCLEIVYYIDNQCFIQIKNINQLKTVFGQIKDFRRSHKRLHDLESILIIGIISVICGAETWNQMEEYAGAKEEFLLKFLKLDDGIPPRHL
jgi:hypothetical protein